MDKLDRSGAAAGLGLLNLDHIYNNVCEQIMDPQRCESHLKWPAVATLGAIMAEPSLLAAVAEVAFDGIAPNTNADQKSWLLAQALFTSSTAQAAYEVEHGLELSPSDRAHINPKAAIAVQDYISHDQKLAVMKFYVMADTELTHIAMNWPAGPYGQYRIGDDGYVTDEQFERVIPNPLDQSLYEYIANGGPLTDEVISAAVRGEAGYIDTLASQAIDNDPDAPVYYTEGEQDEWEDSLNDGFVEESELKTERAHVMPGTKNLIAQISKKLGGGTEGALHTTAPDRTANFHYGQS